MSIHSMGKPGNSLLAFLDVETTGLTPWFGDRICEIAVIRCQGDEIIDTFDTLVNPQRPISPGASRVNGLTDDDVRDAPRFGDVVENVKAMLADAIIVCHNAPFDLGFVSSEFIRLGQQFPEVQVIDTLSLAREYFYFESNSLQAVAGSLMIGTSSAHRALGDALTTRGVLQHFLGRLKKIPLDQLINIYSPLVSTPGNLNLPPLIEEALSSKKRLLIHYIDQKGDETQRWITPKQVLAYDDDIYLVAHCHMRDEERYFRLDRIAHIDVEETEE